jgi:hypothetical protein
MQWMALRWRFKSPLIMSLSRTLRALDIRGDYVFEVGGKTCPFFTN